MSQIEAKLAKKTQPPRIGRSNTPPRCIRTGWSSRHPITSTSVRLTLPRAAPPIAPDLCHQCLLLATPIFLKRHWARVARGRMHPSSVVQRSNTTPMRPRYGKFFIHGIPGLAARCTFTKSSSAATCQYFCAVRQRTGRGDCVAVPSWMFDRAACLYF
jgi:hypothetical protein